MNQDKSITFIAIVLRKPLLSSEDSDASATSSRAGGMRIVMWVGGSINPPAIQVAR
jgi:hypothetical protein